jgi:hypothetical protein
MARLSLRHPRAAITHPWGFFPTNMNRLQLPLSRELLTRLNVNVTYTSTLACFSSALIKAEALSAPKPSATADAN